METEPVKIEQDLIVEYRLVHIMEFYAPMDYQTCNK